MILGVCLSETVVDSVNGWLVKFYEDREGKWEKMIIFLALVTIV